MSRPRTDAPSVDPRVYPEREDSRLLARFAHVESEDRVVEVGCGAGLAARTAARGARRVVATDLNPFALAETRRSAAREGIRIDLVRTDLAAGLGRFDLVLANPPYLPTPPGVEDPDRWVDLALNGGPDGCQVLDRLVSTLPDHLLAGGRAFVLTSSRQAPARLEAIFAAFGALGGSTRVVASENHGGEVLSVRELRPSRKDES